MDKYYLGRNRKEVVMMIVIILIVLTDCLVLCVILIVCYTGPYPVLDPKPPRVSLIAVTPVLSLVLQLLINFVVQMIVWTYTAKQPWLVDTGHEEAWSQVCMQI